MNNKGISIAINQVVMILIGIVILGLGIAFIAKIMTAAEYALPSIDSQLEDQLKSKLGRDNVVELTQSVQRIGAKDLAIFNLGVLNDQRISMGEQFTVIMNFDHAINKKNLPICGQDECEETMNDAILAPELIYNENNHKFENDFTINYDELKIISLGVVPAENPNYAGPGQYFYNICVCEGLTCNKQYGIMQECYAGGFGDLTNGYGFKTFSVIVE